ncbi:hypothetical protein BH09PLA1_BH09PLA1_17030 [soil metagenome]
MSDTQPQQDRSTRFILDDAAPLLANLAALRAIDPRLAANLEAMESLPSYSLSPSRANNGEPSLIMSTSDGREILLHSRHDPQDEARRLIDPLPLEERAAFAIWGFGLGYHVTELFDRAGDDAILCVFEPDLVMLRTAFESRDFSALILSSRVMFFTELDKADLFARLHPHMPAVSLGLESITHAPSVQLAPDFYKQLQFLTNEFESYVRTTIATLVINGRRTSENIARNLPWYVAAPGVARLKNCYAKKPAIIVSAGPSLRKNMHLLKDAQGKSVIIAVQTTLQPLMEIGVRPQFVTSLDYHDICTRFFEKLPKDLTTELIAEPKASNAVFDLNPGPLSLLGNEFADGLISEMKLDRPRLTSGATVAHLAFYLAEHMGCDPIIFVGQDLGFSDGLCYSPGTSYENVWRPELSRFNTLEMKQWEQIVRDRNILRRIPDYQGRPTYTEERLFTYLQHFERDFAKTKSRVIDATEGGVMKRGAAAIKLADVLNTFCQQPFDVSPPAHPGMDWSRLSDCRNSLANRREQAEQVERISREVMPLLEEVRDKITDQKRVNQIISQIDSKRARMHEFAACYGLIMSLTQQSELKKYQADRRIAAAKHLDATAKQRRQVERDIDNVRSVIEAAEVFKQLIDDVTARIGAQIESRGQADEMGARREAAEMENIGASISMLHEDAADNPDAPQGAGPLRLNNATRSFRGEPVLSWTMRRLTRSQRIGNIAVLCWEDQLPPVEEIAEEHHAYVLAKGPRQRLASVEAISAARRWTDGWRGGLLSTCDFDLGFHPEWIKELSDRMESDAIVLIDPASALVDPALVDSVIEHASTRQHVELCFSQAPPGLGGVLLRPAMLTRLCESRIHPGRAVHYMPEAPARDPISTDACAPIATPIARSARSFRLDSHRQIVRINHASASLNGTLAASDAEAIVNRFSWTKHVDEFPREIVIELNTNRRSAPIYWPGRYQQIERQQAATIEQWTALLAEASAADDLRLTIGGAGDPLESDLLFPLIDAAKSVGVRSIHVQTDLLGDDPKTVEMLATSGIDAVSINIPAMTVETYATVMGVDGLKQVLNNIATFVRARSAAGRGVPLIVPTFVKLAANLAEMELWYDQWLGAVGCAVIDGPSDFGGLVPNLSLAEMSPTCRSACARISSRLTILSDGSAVACEQDVLGKTSCGNIASQSLREIWTTRLAPLRADHANKNWSSHSPCASCKEWHRS